MGKVEKVIVLSVLFLIALILVVSLTVDDPLDKSHVVEAGTAPNSHIGGPASGQTPGSADPKPAPEIARADGAAGTPAPAGASGLLNSQVQTGGIVDTATPTVPAVPPTTPPAGPNGLAPGALLKTLDGLQDSILPEMKLYTWKEGDSYRLIANKYYGDWNKYTVLRRSNEGRTEVHPGEQVFVPVFDSDPVVAAAPTPTPAPQPTVKGKKGAADSTAKKVASKPTPSGKKVHVVKNGESLWKIAHMELGDGGRWKEIYALNKDVLPSESSVHVGQTLRIP
jgi:nucleoid-associated protein YgaU